MHRGVDVMASVDQRLYITARDVIGSDLASPTMVEALRNRRTPSLLTHSIFNVVFGRLGYPTNTQFEVLLEPRDVYGKDKGAVKERARAGTLEERLVAPRSHLPPNSSSHLIFSTTSAAFDTCSIASATFPIQYGFNRYDA